MPGLYRFGPYELDADEGTLTRNGNRIKLQDLPYRLLLMLVEQPGQIVSREAVRQRLWPENTFVEFDNSLGVAVRKIRDALADNADSPVYVETLPRRGYRFLAPVAAAVPQQVGTSQTPPPANTVVPSVRVAEDQSSTPSRSRYLVFGVAGLLAVTSAILSYRWLIKKKASPRAPTVVSTAPGHVRRSVAVIGFRNLPGQPADAWLSSAFAEMLTTELGADGTLRIISGEDVARARRELPLSDEDTLGKSTLDRLRIDPGADVVVLGSYTPLPGRKEKRIRLDVRLQDTVRGETIAEQAFVGNEDDLFELVSQAGASLRRSLGATPVSGELIAQTRAALPTKPLAVRLYTQGLERLWALDFVKARDLLIQAASVEPEFPLTHAALSDAWNHLGYSLKARDEAERARSHSQHLGPEEQLQVEALYYSSQQDRSKAIDAYRKLFARFPDNLDYGLRLADQQRRLNIDDALNTLTMLRNLPSSAKDDPRIDILEARIWMDRNAEKTQTAGRRAIQKGQVQGSNLLVAYAYGVLCQTLGDGSSTAQAIQDCENARRGFAAGGDRNNEARTLNDFAGLYYQMGNIDRAEKMYRDALLVFRQLGEIEGMTTASSNLGDIAMTRGNLAEAARLISEAIPGYKEMGDKDGLALTFNDLGDIARLQGDLRKAQRFYEQGKVTAQEMDDKRALGYVLNGMGDVLFDRGDLEGAEKSYEDSLAIRKQIGDKQAAAESELSLARLAVEAGRASDAEAVIRTCKEQFHQDLQADDELSASIALISAFVAESKLAQAEKTIDQTRPLAEKSANKFLHLQIAIESARAEAVTGHGASARAKLENAIHFARSHHMREVELEARLAAAEADKGSPRSTGERQELLALEDFARTSGFILIANKARSLRIGS